MKAIVVQMTPKMIQEFDEPVKAGYFPNRNELIRMSVRDLLLNRKELNFSTRILNMRMNRLACPECGAYINRAEPQDTEGNYYYCGNCHTVFYRCKRAKEKALDKDGASILDKDVRNC